MNLAGAFPPIQPNDLQNWNHHMLRMLRNTCQGPANLFFGNILTVQLRFNGESFIEGINC
jgi:hypothetical protein